MAVHITKEVSTMPEHAHHDAERSEHRKDSGGELIGTEQLEHARRHAEAQLSNTEIDSADRRADAAREVIHKREPEPTPAPVTESEKSPVHAAFTHVLNPKLNYAETVASIQRRLTPASRAFSKVIHAPAIEKSSEALEKTVARPSVTAGATWTALIIGSIFYFTARRYGYVLSGSEIELSFVVGAVLGLILEWVWRTFIRRPRHR
jgi:hypothetical protein